MYTITPQEENAVNASFEHYFDMLYHLQPGLDLPQGYLAISDHFSPHTFITPFYALASAARGP